MTFWLSIALTPLAFAGASSVETYKHQDGMIARCERESDAGTIGYKPGLPIARIEGETVELTLSIFGMLCKSAENGVEWTVRNLNDSYESRDHKGELAKMRIAESRAIFMDQLYRKLYVDRLLANEMMQIVKAPLPLEKLLSADEKSELDSGREVAVKVNYFHRMKQESTFADGSRKTRSTEGGAYTFSFTLSRVAGELKISGISVN